MFSTLSKIRGFLSLFTLLSTVWAFSQAPLPSRPDLVVNIREHSSGAEYVQVTAVRGDYPSDLLKAQCNEIGRLLGSSPRGLTVGSTSLSTQKELAFMRANFATDHIIEGDNLNLEPILKAVAGAPEPYTVKVIQILVEGVPAGPNRLNKYRIPGVLDASAASISFPVGIEYRVNLESQDPAKITFPERYVPPETSQKDTSAPAGPNRPLLIGLFVLAGLALGALVYLLMARSSGASRR